MKVLITGSLGLIGRNVIPSLAKQFDLVLTDIRAGEIDGLPVAAIDVADYEAVLEASRGVDAILHMAIASVRDIVTDVESFDNDEGPEYLKFNEIAIEANVRGTYHIYEAARQNGIGRVVFGSSLTILIGQPRYEAINDDLDPRPSNFYAVTKLWGEQLGEYFSRRHGLRVYCLRFGTPHPQFEVPKYKQWLQAPTGRRTFVTYADLTSAITCALKAEAAQFGAYTIVSGCKDSLYDTSKAAEIGWKSADFCLEDGSVIAG